MSMGGRALLERGSDGLPGKWVSGVFNMICIGSVDRRVGSSFVVEDGVGERREGV